MSLNKVSLIGNLGRDPEERTTQSGGKVVTMSLATTEKWTDKSGQRQERTEWHKVVIFNEKLGQLGAQYLRKGSKVYLEGQLQTRKYTDQAGVEKSVTEIVLGQFKGELRFLSGGARQDGPAGAEVVEQPDPIPDDIPF